MNLERRGLGQEKKNGQGKLPLWRRDYAENSAAMREEFDRMDKRTALYNGTREIDKVPNAKKAKAQHRQAACETLWRS